MSSWLAALGPCASPKSKAKGRNKGNTLERPVNLSSLQRRGSLTDIKNTRKVTSQRSFREKLHDTFDGSLRRAKKAGSLEAVPHGGHTISNPDTNMNLATSLSPKAYGSVRVQGSSSEQGSPSMHEKFWTNFYNTLPRNRYKGDRPKDLSLQDLPVTEITDSEAHGRNDIQQRSLSPSEGNAQWQVYATSPRTKRKNRSLERMNSAPSTRKSPMRRDQDETRPGSDGKASPQMLDAPVEYFDSGTGSAFVILPRSVSLQEEYWVPGTKGAHKRDLRKISPSPERIIISQGHSPMGSPVQVQGHVWVKTKDGSHLELRPVECAPRDLPSPSESQKTDMSSLSYITAESSLSNQPSPIQKQAPGFINTTQTQEHPYLGPYLTPEEYQANIFDLIQSLNQNQSPPNPGSPQEKQPTSLEENRGTEGDHESKTYHSEKFIVLGSGEKEPTASKQDGGNFEKRYLFGFCCMVVASLQDMLFASFAQVGIVCISHGLNVTSWLAFWPAIVPCRHSSQASLMVFARIIGVWLASSKVALNVFVLFVCVGSLMAQSTTRSCRASQLIVALFLGKLRPSKRLISTKQGCSRQ